MSAFPIAGHLFLLVEDLRDLARDIRYAGVRPDPAALDRAAERLEGMARRAEAVLEGGR